MITLALLLALADPTTPAPATPPPAPTANEVRRVYDYFLYGAASGPILLELTACKTVGKNAEGKLACEEKHADTAKKGDPLIAFVRFFVPKGGKYDDVKVKFLLNGEVRTTTDFTLSESFSYGNYKQTTASKPGTWEMQILRGDTLLASQKVVVE